MEISQKETNLSMPGFAKMTLHKVNHFLRRLFQKSLFLGCLGSATICSITYFLLPLNKWNSFFTPDSEFYLSLMVFGNDLVEKVANPSYYWTKSAQVIPEHLISSIFGWEYGLQIVQFIKLFAIAFSSFVIFFSTRSNFLIAFTFVSFLTLNGTMLTMLGNTYVTATALTILTVFYAIMKLFLDSTENKNRKHFISVSIISAVLTFSLFIYPLLTFNLLIIFASYILYSVIINVRSILYHLRVLLILGVTAGTTFSLLLFITKSEFPKQNWLGTIMFYVNNLNPGDYSNDNKYSVLFGDFSLLVIGTGAFISIYVILNRQNFTPNTFCVATSQVLLILFALFQIEFLDSAALEASFISAFYWVPSLLITCLYLIEVVPENSFTRLKTILFIWIVFGSFVFLRFLSDHFFKNYSYSIMINVVLISVVVLLVFFQRKFFFGKSFSLQMLFALFIYLSFAHFQNSRELSNSAIGRIPYFSSSEDREPDEARGHIILEKALLSQLNGEEKAVVWTPPGSNLVTYAAMHFWGPNSISLGKVISLGEANYYKVVRPEKLFIYVSYRDEGSDFLKSLESNGIRYSLAHSIRSFDTNGVVFYTLTYNLTYQNS
jgi:hypothetical protein